MGTLIAASLALAVLTGCSSAPAHTAAKYGTLPSFLPKDSIHPDSVLHGTAARPALTTEGDAVQVTLPDGSALATVAGPEVPGEGLPYQTAATTCTWIITVKAMSGVIPLVASDFTSIDHLGVVYRPTWIAGQPRPPAALKAGQSATFELRAVMTVGEGLMRWAPMKSQIVASWDFEVEND